MILSPDPAYGSSKTRQVIASAVNTSVWLAGVLFFHWDIYELHFLLTLDMGLFIGFAFLKIVCSMDSEESFFTSLPMRLFLGLLFSFFISVIVFSITGINESGWDNLLDKPTGWVGRAPYPGNWIFGVMIINYFGYFLHDFIYTGKYKTANPGMEGFADYVSVLVMSIVLTAALALGGNNTEDGYWFSSAIGIILGRFVMQLFLDNSARIIFNKKDMEV